MAPKGDAERLKADKDDGWASVSNLLSEALCRAPLSGTELRVVWFVIRRTYGWARNNAPEYRGDVFTAKRAAEATNIPIGQVHRCLRELQRANVLWGITVRADNTRAYGVNTDIASWGTGRGDWAGYAAGLKDAKDTNQYCRESMPQDTEVYTQEDIPLYPTVHSYIPSSTEVGAQTPAGAGAPEAPTDKTTENDSKHPSDVCATGLFDPEEVPAIMPPEPPSTAAANACLAVWGLVHTDLPTDIPKGSRAKTPPKTAYYSSMGSIIGKLSGGAEELDAWAEAEGPGTRKLGTDAKPWSAIPEVVRAEVTAGTWQAAWQKARGAGGSNGQGSFVTMSDGSRSYSREWDELSDFPPIISRESAAGNWDARRGATKTPVVGMTCVDGWFYTSGPYEDGKPTPKRLHEVAL